MPLNRRHAGEFPSMNRPHPRATLPDLHEPPALGPGVIAGRDDEAPRPANCAGRPPQSRELPVNVSWVVAAGAGVRVPYRCLSDEPRLLERRGCDATPMSRAFDPKHLTRRWRNHADRESSQKSQGRPEKFKTKSRRPGDLLLTSRFLQMAHRARGVMIGRSL